MPAPLPVPLCALSTAEPALSALLKLLAIVVQSGRPLPLEAGLLIAPAEVEPAGLTEADVRALLAANYAEGWKLGGGVGPPWVGAAAEGRLGTGLTLTEEGLALIGTALGGLGRASGQVVGSDHPRWVPHERGGGELHLRGALLKRVRHDSLGQRRVLEECERRGWPAWIPSPLAGGPGTNRKKALRDALRRLNEGQDPRRVRFHAHDGGVRWEIVG